MSEKSSFEERLEGLTNDQVKTIGASVEAEIARRNGDDDGMTYADFARMGSDEKELYRRKVTADMAKQQAQGAAKKTLGVE